MLAIALALASSGRRRGLGEELDSMAMATAAPWARNSRSGTQKRQERSSSLGGPCPISRPVSAERPSKRPIEAFRSPDARRLTLKEANHHLNLVGQQPLTNERLHKRCGCSDDRRRCQPHDSSPLTSANDFIHPFVRLALPASLIRGSSRPQQ